MKRDYKICIQEGREVSGLIILINSFWSLLTCSLFAVVKKAEENLIVFECPKAEENEILKKKGNLVLIWFNPIKDEKITPKNIIKFNSFQIFEMIPEIYI